MLAASTPTTVDPLLERIDYGLVSLGAIILIVALVQWWRAGWRDPLRGSPIRVNRLSPIWLWVACLGQFFGVLLGAALLKLTTPNATPEEEPDVGMTLLATSLQQIVALLACLAIAHVTFIGGWRGLARPRRAIITDTAYAVGALLVAICLCWVVLLATRFAVSAFFPYFEDPDHEVLTTLRKDSAAAWMKYVAVLGALVLAPVSEELFFRGILQTGIKKLIPPQAGSMRHRRVAILIPAAVFGLMHLPVPHHVPALIVLGIVLGYAYERSGSLLVPIAMHILFNAKTLLYEMLRQLWA